MEEVKKGKKKEVSGDVQAAEEVMAAAPKKAPHDPMQEIVEVHCFVPIRINGKEYFGNVKVTRAMAESMIEMLSKKKAADARVHIGREFERSKVDGQLVIRDAATKVRVEA